MFKAVWVQCQMSGPVAEYWGCSALNESLQAVMEEEAFGGNGELPEEELRNSDREEAFGEGRSYNKEWCLLRHGVGVCKTNFGNHE